jgi:hypothetical protein
MALGAVTERMSSPTENSYRGRGPIDLECPLFREMVVDGEEQSVGTQEKIGEVVKSPCV